MGLDRSQDEVAESAARLLLGPGGPRERFDTGARADEYDALRHLLLAGRTGDDALTEPLAEALAAGCLGDQHLYLDLRLGSRAELRAVLERWFGPLAAENTKDMRWKRFFYKRLCGWGGFDT